MKKYFDTGLVDVNIEDDSGMTLLMHACEHGHLPVVKYLVENQNANVAARDEKKMTPLMYACSTDHLPVVKYLLEEQNSATVNIEQRDEEGATALSHACIHGHLPTVKYLVEERKAKIYETFVWSEGPATAALKHGHIPIVKFLVLKEITNENHRNKFMLHALRNGHDAIVKDLLNERNISIPDRSALLSDVMCCACEAGQLSIVKYVVEEKDIVGVMTQEAFDTMLGFYVKRALDHKHISIARYLLDERNYSLTSEKYRDALLDACCRGSVSALKYLLEEKILDVETRGLSIGVTCLTLACQRDHLPVIRYLVEERHADVNVKDRLGRSPLMYACQHGNLSVVRYLVEERNVNVGAIDNSGDTCFKHALDCRQTNIAEYLMFECMMDPPRKYFLSGCEMGKYIQKFLADPRMLKRKRIERIRDGRKFIQQMGLEGQWKEQRECTFHQLIPLHVSHIYSFVKTNHIGTLSNLKVYFEDKAKGPCQSQTVIYAQKEKLSKSCTFMKNLLTGEMNDVKDDPDDPGMQMVTLSEELVQDCPGNLLEQLIIFLSCSKDGDCLKHHVTGLPEDSENYLFPEMDEAVNYYRTLNALGIEMDLSEWMKKIIEIVRAYNIKWMESVHHSDSAHKFGLDDLYCFTPEMFDTWTQVLGEHEDVYFFMLINAVPVSSSSPTSIAPRCHSWLKENGQNQKYKDALGNYVLTSILKSTTGYDVQWGSLMIPVHEAEAFVKRKKRRTE